MLEGLGFECCKGKDFDLLQAVVTSSGVHLDSYSLGTSGYFPGLQLLVHDVGYLAPCSTEVKKEWCYTSAPSKCLLSMDRDNSTLNSS